MPQRAEPRFQSERLDLRLWCRDDPRAAVAFWGDPTVMRFVDAGRTLDEDRIAASLLRGLRHEARHGYCLWAVEERASGSLIGACGFHAWPPDAGQEVLRFDRQAQAAAERGSGPALELAVHLAPWAWGQGYAQEAARACLRHSLDQLGTRRWYASTHPENRSARRLLERLGMQPSGRITHDGHEEAFYGLWAPLPDSALET